MPRYVKFDDVRLRLIGKVRFTDEATRENEMPEALALRLIAEGEAQVELDLSPRYAAPFQTTDGKPFANLPDVTRDVLRAMAEMQGVMKILDIDFGRGTVVDAAKYYENLEKRYNKMKDQLLERRDDYGSGWLLPPLPGLRTGYQNIADDGFVGRVMVAGSWSNAGAYPAARINDPSLTFWGGTSVTFYPDEEPPI